MKTPAADGPIEEIHPINREINGQLGEIALLTSRKSQNATRISRHVSNVIHFRGPFPGPTPSLTLSLIYIPIFKMELAKFPPHVRVRFASRKAEFAILRQPPLPGAWKNTRKTIFSRSRKSSLVGGRAPAICQWKMTRGFFFFFGQRFM